MCDKKNSVLFNDTECTVLSPNFKLIDESQVLLKVPRKNNMYSVDLKNIVPKRGLTCLFAKATSDESKLWHRRLGHLNFKTMNKLVKGNLVRGLPSKLFENDETCVACQKGKQHRASCKSKTENSISLPLHLLHMNLFGPTLVKSLMKKMYCLVVIDDYSRFTWVFFLATKDETSGILKSFITGIENLVDHKVKVIRCDNGTEFKNREMNQFCEMKGSRPYWLFDIDALTRTTNYEPIVASTQSNGFADPKSSHDDGSKPLSDDGKKVDEDPRKDSECKDQEKEDNVNNTNTVNAASINEVNDVGGKTSIKLPFDTNMLTLEDDSIFDFSRDNEDDGVEVDINNLDTTIQVFRNKKDKKGIMIRYKAQRVLLKGYTQRRGLTYDKSLPLVARIKSIRLFLAYASFKDFVVYQMDVKSVFLYGKIKEEVYVCQPLGFEDPDFPDRVYKVEKALYGLHQAPRAWYKGDILLVQVYVDDIIFGSTKMELCIAFEKLMHEKFQMSSIGELTFFLGLQVKLKKYGIFISQDNYVDEFLKKFRFTEVKTTSTPIETQKPLLKDEDDEEVDVHMYRSMIGSLMYLTSLRPDIMFTVCACARYQVNPKVSHLHAVKRIFRYLKGQPKLGLWYPKDSPFDLVAYTDSDYAGASLDRKSTTGGCQFLGCRLISWQCKKQTVVANSIIEAEYVAASSCCG
ncbi:putative ribonuclease H-like domain-containing protein [Tanacetum coccineum]